jgi:hypothetical protein
VPTILPIVESAYRRPTVPPVSAREVSLSRTANGVTIPRQTLAGANSTTAAINAFHSRAILPADTIDRKTSLMRMVAEIRPPAANITAASSLISGRLSARRPPNQYPKLRLANITPIKLVQTYVDVPINGDRIREPMISNTITSAPQINTVSSIILLL